MNLGRAQEIVRGRSLGLCELCRRQGVHTHHRQNRGMGGVHRAGTAVNRPAALVRLCLDCHTWIGHEPTRAEVLGLLIPRTEDPAERPVFLAILYGAGWWLLNDDGDYAWWHGPVSRVDFPHLGDPLLV